MHRLSKCIGKLAGLIASVCLGAIATALPVHAQVARDNAISESNDAFGTTIGLETTGTYSENDTRGFNPLDAGNSRIDGIYFDQVWNLPSRLRRSTAIRVGFSAVDTPFVAPTGLVDQQLYPVPKEAGNSLVFNRHYYGGHFNEWEFRLPLNDRLAVRGGFGYATMRQSDGTDSTSHAITLRGFARIGEIELSPFYAFGKSARDEAKPLVVVSSGYVPKVPPSRKFLGQKWTAGTRDYYNAGATLKGPLVGNLSFRGGLFRSVNDRASNFAEIYDVRTPDMQARHYALADPSHDNRSTSGEGLFVMRFANGGNEHRIFAGFRGRDRVTETGGSQLFDFGVVPYGLRDRHPEPEYSFAESNRGRVRQTSLMAAYVGTIGKVAHINLGVQKARYRASIRNGETGVVDRARADPWLYNAALTIDLAPKVSAYLATQRGLEDSGLAPSTAANRDEQLPAVRSSQYEGGLRWDFGKGKLVMAGFQITKPHFSFAPDRNFVVSGDQRHRGIEASLAGQLLERLNVVAGIVAMDPKVTGPGRLAGRVGPRPTGVPKLFGKLDLNYRTDLPGSLVLVGSLEYRGSVPATAARIAHLGDKQLMIDPFWTIDLGSRQTIQINKTTIAVRILVRNVLDKASWRVTAPNVMFPTQRRSVLVNANIDF